jgi:undecaprenyl-diphosphatase
MLSFQNLILLSCIQGITEFLPISSSAHLIIFPNLLNNPDQGRVFDVAVHFGSLIAVILYFWRDVLNMGLGVLSLGSSSKKDFKLFYITVIASLPLILAGYYIQNSNFLILRSLELIAWCTLIFGIILYLVDTLFLRIKKIEDLSIVNGLIIGTFQILAFLPGTSRSGITITAGRLMGFDRKSAAKFSLLLSIPAILGATTLELYDLIKENNYELSINILNAAILSFTFSLLSIHFMMKWISNYTFTPFVIYRVLLGTVLLLAIYFW